MNRTVCPEIPPRVEYSLTELALSLAPVRDALIEWGFRYIAYRQAADAGELPPRRPSKPENHIPFHTQ